jgi:hypothetical protein
VPDPRDPVALQALALLANLTTSPASRHQLSENPEEALIQAFQNAGKSREEAEAKVAEVPEEVLGFFADLSTQELQLLGRLQRTMTTARMKADFPSLSEDVDINPPASLGKL